MEVPVGVEPGKERSAVGCECRTNPERKKSCSASEGVRTACVNAAQKETLSLGVQSSRRAGLGLEAGEVGMKEFCADGESQAVIDRLIFVLDETGDEAIGPLAGKKVRPDTTADSDRS